MIQNTTLKTLLLVDDDRVFLRTLTRAMQRRGYAVSAFTTVAEVRNALENGLRPSYAAFDLKLKDGSGLDLLELINRLSPNSRAIVLTGYGSVETAVAAAKLGISDYIAKPATADTIDAALLGRPRELAAQLQYPRPDEQEFHYLLTMYERHDRNMSETARAIGMHRRTLQRILRRHGIAPMERTVVEPTSERRRALRMFRLWTHLLAGHVPPIAHFSSGPDTTTAV